MNTSDKFICYLDILGFKHRIDEKAFQKCYQYLIDEVIRPFNYPDKVYLLSDSIIIISDDVQYVVDNSFSIYSIALSYGVLIRGALTRGKVNMPTNIQESGNKIIIPSLGKAFIRAYELEKSINCAAICVDSDIVHEIKDEVRKLFFKYKEIFPQSGEDYEKTFLVTDMNNPSVPASIMANIAKEIPNLSKHDITKFINTFCLYYKVLRHNEYKIEYNHDEVLRLWDNLLEKLVR